MQQLIKMSYSDIERSSNIKGFIKDHNNKSKRMPLAPKVTLSRISETFFVCVTISRIVEYS